MRPNPSPRPPAATISSHYDMDTAGAADAPLSPNPTLPIEARQAAWDRLWKRLLQPVPHRSPACEPTEEPDDETTAEEVDSAA